MVSSWILAFIFDPCQARIAQQNDENASRQLLVAFERLPHIINSNFIWVINQTLTSSSLSKTINIHFLHYSLHSLVSSDSSHTPLWFSSGTAIASHQRHIRMMNAKQTHTRTVHGHAVFVLVRITMVWNLRACSHFAVAHNSFVCAPKRFGHDVGWLIGCRKAHLNKNSTVFV